ncbi:STAS domain-containing protein [Cytobacillus massiliigabonensis]|uniref:STAS domain-containing protein n=1 Tax=Cytobacillus massiliigabonensis TaxID=1871011 RepID=UPI000C83A3D4|nr:STAS domain-containing protein [Cytobacillus massiliigabonensis]
MKININKQYKGNEILVFVEGEIDAYTAPKLREELWHLSEKENTTITINLMEVTYLDSTGLGVFVGLFKRLNSSNGELKLIELSNRLFKLFEMTGLLNIMNIRVNSVDGGR